MLDATTNMILIDGRIRTGQIEVCRYEAPDSYCILFTANPKAYLYRADRVLWLKEPASFDPALYRLTHNGRRLTNIVAIYKFRNGNQAYWHIRFENGTEKDYQGSDLQVTASCLADPAAKHHFQYLQRVAAANALSGDDDKAILAKQYEKFRFISDEKPFAAYLNPGLFTPRQNAKRRLIYPFGSNASQLKAVQTAFEHSISVIQGPPGTGKTQTILNIIANILVSGKTALVVSNNNAATDNVLEKLIQYGFGFLAAPLGKSENKKRFIETQKREKQYPETLASWNFAEADRPEFSERIDRQARLLSKLFAKQERLALAKQELQELETEQQHYRQESRISDGKIALRRTADIPHLTRLWFDLQHLAEETAQRSGLFDRIRQRLDWFAIRLRSRHLLKGLTRAFFRRDLSDMIADLHAALYAARLQTLRTEIAELETYMATQQAEE